MPFRTLTLILMNWRNNWKLYGTTKSKRKQQLWWSREFQDLWILEPFANKAVFEFYHNAATNIETANGNLMNVPGKGTVLAETKLGLASFDDVLHCPSLCESALFSVSKFDVLWWQVLVGTHLALNHPSPERLRQVESGLVTGCEVSGNIDKNCSCSACFIGKSKQTPYPSKSLRVLKVCGDLVSVDGFGPIRHP